MVDIQQFLAFRFRLPVRRLITDDNNVGTLAHPRIHYRACLPRKFLGVRAAHRKPTGKYYPLAIQGTDSGRLSRRPGTYLESGEHLGGALEALSSRPDATLQD